MYVPGVEQVGVRLWRRWVMAGRLPAAVMKEGAGTWVLAHNLRYKTSFALMLVLFGGAYYAGFWHLNVFAGDPAWKRGLIHAGIVGIVALALYMAACAFYDRVELSEAGLALRRAFRKEARVTWEEIEGVGLALNGEEIVLRLKGGSTKTVSLFMNGLGTLRGFLERRLRHETWAGVGGLLPHASTSWI